MERASQYLITTTEKVEISGVGVTPSVETQAFWEEWYRSHDQQLFNKQTIIWVKYLSAVYIICAQRQVDSRAQTQLRQAKK